MSIKNKKNQTSNAYRLKKIEDYLISEGYVCTTIEGDTQNAQCWVDCISTGYDISYNADRVPDGGDEQTLDFFHIGQGLSGYPLFQSRYVKGAVQWSRSIPGALGPRARQYCEYTRDK